MLPFKSRRTSQPQDLAQLDRSVFDPELLLLGSVGPVNLGSGSKTITGTPSAYKVTRNGKSFYFNGASPGRLYTSVPAPVYVAPEFTFVVAYTPDAAPSGGGTYSSVIFSNYLHLSWDHPSGSAQGVVQWQDTGGYWSSISLLSKTGGKPTTVCVTMKNGTLSVYQDGAYCGSQAGVWINSAGDFWDFGERGNGNGFWWPGSIELAATSTKAVSTILARDLSADPWLMFKPVSRHLWFLETASGGAATVIPIGQQATGSVGTLVATGAAKGLPVGVSASSAVGTPVAVGGSSIPATVTPAGVSASGSVGAATATGQAKTYPSGVSATASVGSAVAVGQARAFPPGVSASTGVGTPVAVAGGAAIATPSGVQAIGAVGNLIATGQAWRVASGVSATGAVGTPVVLAGGSAIATPAGLQAVGAVGNLIATGAAWCVPGGVSASGAVGTPVATVPGAAVYPLASQVLAGVQYGPTGADYVGTLTGGSGPSAADIAAAVWSYTQ